MSSANTVIVGLLGVVSHIVYFKRGEHHLYGTTYVKIFAGVLVASVLAAYQAGTPIGVAVTQATRLATSYLLGLYASLIIYRSVLHPLHKFPGPFGAKISRLWLSAYIQKSGAGFRAVQQLHERYGDFVRVGPSDLSVVHPKAMNAIYGPASKCSKGPWYEINRPQVSLQTERDKPAHDQRRRLWSTAFSDKAVRGYEERTRKYRSKLVAQIEAYGGQPVNVSRWFNFYTYDTMGDLSFGKSYQMLEANEHHWAIELFVKGIDVHHWHFPVWFLRMLRAIPGALGRLQKALRYGHKMVERRMTEKHDIPDIMSALLEPLQGRPPTKEDLNWLHGDSNLAIVAGSDTTSLTLTCIFLELARHPESIQKLRKELATVMHMGQKDVSNPDLVKLDHLNGVIYEALRMYPAVPTAIERVTPPEGMEIGGQHIPGEMTVWCSPYVAGRNEDIYTDPNQFIPERWYQYPDMVKEKSAYAPFSQGRYSCIGKPLAMMSMRTTVALLVMNFDIKFPEGDVDAGRKCEEGLRDHFTLIPGELDLCFEKL